MGNSFHKIKGEGMEIATDSNEWVRRDGDIATMRSLTIRGSSVQRYQMRHGAQENCFG